MPDRTTREVTITVTPRDELHDRLEQIPEMEQAFAELDLDDDRRTAMCSMVRDALLAMADNVEAWLPNATIKTRDELGIFVLWRVGYLDEEVLRLRGRADSEQARRVADLLRVAGSSAG